MKIKVVTHPETGELRVLNAETNEILENVLYVDIHADGINPRPIVTFAVFDPQIDITGEGVVKNAS